MDHELAHYATKSENVSSTSPIGNIMRYNKSIAPNRSWEDFSATLPKSLSKEEMEHYREYYEYMKSEQEKRAVAYSLYQMAIRKGLTTDELVNRYTLNGNIAGYAPEPLRRLNIVLTPDNIKQYLNNFLSISAPIGIGTGLTLNNSQYEKRNISR